MATGISEMTDVEMMQLSDLDSIESIHVAAKNDELLYDPEYISHHLVDVLEVIIYVLNIEYFSLSLFLGSRLFIINKKSTI
jgi:hypothetical protein